MSLINIERRIKKRFPISLPLTYITLGRNPFSGRGHTVNLSSSGLLISTDEPYWGRKAEISIEWPVLLHGTVGLQFKVIAILVRTDGRRSAFEMESHKFRTCALKRIAVAS
jgi:hypothetical protein